MSRPIRIHTCAVLTISTGGAEGRRQDTSGPIAKQLAEEAGFAVVQSDLLPDDLNAIVDLLTRWCDGEKVDLILTTGGTGFAQSDVTPEATRRVLQREASGIAEAMRAGTVAKAPMAMLSRGIAGTRGGSLIVNLPGSPKAVRECLGIILPVLHHAVSLLRGEPDDH
jgi:molybdopterin adenylyltransferase